MEPSRRQFFQSCAGTLASGLLAPSLAAVPGRMYSAFGNGGGTAQKVIIDTDPGVDDAFALFLAARSPELQIEAVTAVAGNVPLNLTLANALRLVEIAGRDDIPVASGASSPLIRTLVDAAYAHGNNGLAGVNFPEAKLKPVKKRAADLICKLVRTNPGAIVIVAIGPLTNVALALREDPEIAPMVQGIVLMGGSLSGGNVTPAAEFNFYVDPEAASIVFNSGIPIRMVGLDVTRKVAFTEEHIAQLRSASSAVSQAAASIADSVMKMHRAENSASQMHLHDPLAVSSLINPDVLTFEDYHIAIETSGTFTAGESVGWKHRAISYSAPLQTSPFAATPPYSVNAKVATGVDSAKFFELLIARLTTGHP
jgi:inosine-uridine nucleoside N-ribohydrolase